MRPRFRVGSLVCILATAALAIPAAGQSPAPSSPSPSPADCTAPAALLPPSIDDLPVDTTITAGVAAIDPDELLDPVLGSLGRTRSDVCVVAFRYGGANDALAGQLLRIADVEVTDLAERFVDALGDRLVAYGAQASPSSVDAAGHLAWSLDIRAAGQRSRVLAVQLGDTLLITSGLDAMDRLLPLLVVEATPTPSAAAPTPSAVVPGPSAAPASPTG